MGTLVSTPLTDERTDRRHPKGKCTTSVHIDSIPIGFSVIAADFNERLKFTTGVYWCFCSVSTSSGNTAKQREKKLMR